MVRLRIMTQGPRGGGGVYQFTVNSITWNSTDIKSSMSGNLIVSNGAVYGTATTNSTTYDVYAFGNTNTQGSSANNYTINYTCTQPTYIYALAVGGGGGGGTYIGAGGGAGGVVMMPIYVPTATSAAITVSVGAGGGTATTNSSGTCTREPTNGVNSTITFSDTTVTPNTITALYGDFGQGLALNKTQGGGSIGVLGTGGASTGGRVNYSGWQTNITTLPPTNNSYYNFGNYGSIITITNGGGGGGGGAGSKVDVNSKGGDGIKCVLPGIKDFSTTGYSLFGSYYWGGGGGGSANNSYESQSPGGLGGGGGAYNSNGSGGTSGSGGIYPGGVVITTPTKIAAPGGPCTGSGGGGSFNIPTSISGGGGSGIVVLAIPRVQQSSFLIKNYNFASPSLTNNAYLSSAAISDWSIGGTGTYYLVNGTGTSPSTIWDASYACPYVQFFYTNTNTSVTLSQTVTLEARPYTMTFCAAVNSSYTSGSFTVSVGGTNVYTSTTDITSTKRAWNVYSFNFTPPTAGSNVILFTFTCSVGITQLLLF